MIASVEDGKGVRRRDECFLLSLDCFTVMTAVEARVGGWVAFYYLLIASTAGRPERRRLRVEGAFYYLLIASGRGGVVGGMRHARLSTIS